MTTIVQVERLYDRLTAKERALLVLRSWKEGKEEDPAWRSTMPMDQGYEFNRLIDLMNGVNQHLAPFVFAVAPEADKFGLRLGWLAGMTLWQHQAFEVGDLLLGPKGARVEGVELPGAAKARLRKALAHAPAVPTVYVSEEFQRIVANEVWKANRSDEAVAAHKDALREGVPAVWAQLRAADLAISEAAEDFDGEDPARPELRHILDHGLERLKGELREEAERYIGPLELAEPDDELLEKCRGVVRQRSNVL